MKTITFSLSLLLSFVMGSCNSKKNAYIHTSNEEIKSLMLNDTITFLRTKVIGTNKIISINEKFDDSKVVLLEDSEIIRPFMSFSNNLEEDISLKLFLEKMFFLDNSLLKIVLYRKNVDLFFSTKKSTSFYGQVVGDSSQWIFNHYRYHDIYYSLFSFEGVSAIRVFVDGNLDKETEIIDIYNNVTLLPLTGDYNIKLPNGKMCKKWYRKKTNYWDFFKGPILDNKSSFNKGSEIKEAILDSIFN